MALAQAYLTCQSWQERIQRNSRCNLAGNALKKVESETADSSRKSEAKSSAANAGLNAARE